MKKTLVALAALAATSVFAQTTVTLDGYIDRGFLHTSNSNNNSNYRGVTGSIAGTTTFGIKVDEQISPDLNARVWISTDWAENGGATQDSALNGATAATSVGVQGSGFANSQSFLQLESKTFGGIKFGSINSSTLTAVTGVGAPGFSTGVGSSYSSNFSVHDGFTTGNNATGSVGLVTNQRSTAGLVGPGARAIRLGNTVSYSTPVIAGFQATFAIAAKNDNGGTGAAAVAANGTNNLTATRGAATASQLETVGMKEVALRYTNGPLDLMATKIQYVAPLSAMSYGGVGAETRNTQTVFAGNVNLGNLKIYGAMGGSRLIAATELLSIDSKFRQYGVAFDVNAVTSLWLQTAKVDDKTIADIDRKMTGFGANYLLSKRTRAFIRADRIIYNESNPDGIGNKQTRSALGLSHTF